jgi:hypothetical protein
MVSDVAVENVEWAGRGIPNVYHCRCGVFGRGETRANSRLVGNPYLIGKVRFARHPPGVAKRHSESATDPIIEGNKILSAPNEH